MPLDIKRTKNIENHVMLVALNISVFTGERIDRSVAEEVAEKHAADKTDSGRFSKQIISRHALDGVTKAAAAARNRHYQLTLPWNDQGQRLLSVAGLLAYTNEMRSLKAKFDAEVDLFLRVYPQLIESARTRLGTMFNADDYPTASALRSRFNFDFYLLPMPSGSNWFLEIAEEEMEAIRAETDARITESVNAAVKDVYRRIHEATSHMAKKLTEYEVDPETGKVSKGIFRDSLVDNIRELVGLLPALNVLKDPDLDKLAAEMREMTRHNAGTLRADEGFRKETAARAAKVAEAAATFL